MYYLQYIHLESENLYYKHFKGIDIKIYRFLVDGRPVFFFRKVGGGVGVFQLKEYLKTDG